MFLLTGHRPSSPGGSGGGSGMMTGRQQADGLGVGGNVGGVGGGVGGVGMAGQSAWNSSLTGQVREYFSI